MEDFNDWTSMKKNIAELREAVRGLNGNQQFGQRGAQTTDRSKTVDVPDAETETPNYPGVDALQHEQAAAEDRVSQFVRTAGAATASRILKIPSSDGAEEASDLGVPSTDDREEPSTLADVTTLPSSIRRELKKMERRLLTVEGRMHAGEQERQRLSEVLESIEAGERSASLNEEIDETTKAKDGADTEAGDEAKRGRQAKKQNSSHTQYAFWSHCRS
eukprot:GHVT01095391.1.p1 GENE.GHVT01095391.1~~GHVT01095391.1.p1  ORF type:complete len:218 (-),score=39.39 GHVT01095391.1:1302-1955(-)